MTDKTDKPTLDEDGMPKNWYMDDEQESHDVWEFCESDYCPRCGGEVDWQEPVVFLNDKCLTIDGTCKKCGLKCDEVYDLVFGGMRVTPKNARKQEAKP